MGSAALVASRTRRGGRPAVPPEERRTWILSVRFSPAEYRLLCRRSEGAPLRTFVRMQALRKRPLPADRVPAVNQRTIGELRRIGNNLNQAVHLIHIGVLPPEFGEILRTLNSTIKAYHRSLLGFPNEAPDAPDLRTDPPLTEEGITGSS